MKLIIDIDEDVIESAQSNPNYYPIYHFEKIWRAIVNGTPLPKGHGRLIDADAFERRCMFDSSIEDMQDVIYALRDYKPIIEADKEESEEV